jgi:hypothetical protein
VGGGRKEYEDTQHIDKYVCGSIFCVLCVAIYNMAIYTCVGTYIAIYYLYMNVCACVCVYIYIHAWLYNVCSCVCVCICNVNGGEREGGREGGERGRDRQRDRQREGGEGRKE